MCVGGGDTWTLGDKNGLTVDALLDISEKAPSKLGESVILNVELHLGSEGFEY